MMFSKFVFDLLIYAALTLTGISAVWLLSLLYRDWRRGELW